MSYGAVIQTALFVITKVFMKKPASRRDKYFLLDLHQKIDLNDRKLAFLGKYVEFASPADREEAETRLLRRDLLLRRLPLELVASGVEYEEKAREPRW